MPTIVPTQCSFKFPFGLNLSKPESHSEILRKAQLARLKNSPFAVAHRPGQGAWQSAVAKAAIDKAARLLALLTVGPGLGSAIHSNPQR